MQEQWCCTHLKFKGALCQYIDTLIIGHKHCIILSILNEIALSKELQHFISLKKKKLQQGKEADMKILKTC